MKRRLALAFVAALLARPASAEEIASYWGWRTHSPVILLSARCSRQPTPGRFWFQAQVLNPDTLPACWLDTRDGAVRVCTVGQMHGPIEQCVRIPVAEMR